MLKTKSSILRMLAVIVGVIVIGVLIYVFGRTSLIDKGKADQALLAGKIEITSAKDLNNYFVFLPSEKIQTLLQESEGKFLFPQIDLTVAGGRPLIIREQKTSMYEHPFNFVTISGLPSGVKIYTTVGVLNRRDIADTIDGFIRGGIAPHVDGTLYIWTKEAWTEEGGGDVMLTYISAPNMGIMDNPALNMIIHEGMFISVEQGTNYATLLTEAPLPEKLVPGGANIAVAIAGADNVFTKLSLQNILTYKGRIVMIERQELKANEATPLIPPVAPPALLIPPMPADLIVLDEIWRNAFLLTIDNIPLMGGIGLSHIPIGAELRAPMDGYVYSDEGQAFVGGEKTNNLFLAKYQQITDEQDNKGIMFIATEMEIVNHMPRKGEVFARVTKNAPVGVDFFNQEVRLGVIPESDDLSFQSNRVIRDPRTYLWATIQHILPTR